MFGFTCKFIEGQLKTSEENTETLWVPKEKVMDFITAPNLIKRFEAYLNFNGEVQYLEYITKPEYQLKGEWNL